MPKEEKIVDKKKEALKVLQEEEEANLMACNKEVLAILQKYGYGLKVQQQIVYEKLK